MLILFLCKWLVDTDGLMLMLIIIYFLYTYRVVFEKILHNIDKPDIHGRATE